LSLVDKEFLKTNFALNVVYKSIVLFSRHHGREHLSQSQSSFNSVTEEGVLFSFLATVMRIIKLKIFPVPVRLHSSYGKLIFVIISSFFTIFKNVVYSFEPGETPSNSASHRAPNYAQRS